MNKNKIANIVIYTILIFILLFLSIDRQSLIKEKDLSIKNYKSSVSDLNKEIKSKDSTIKELTKKIQDLNSEIEKKDEIIKSLPKLDEIMLDNLKDKGIDDPIKIKEDLMKRSELIPYEGSLGGTMSFFSTEHIYVFSDKWVLAYFEDGHTPGYILLRYEIIDERNNDTPKIKWKILDSYIFK